jgi:hypothetical protein
MTEQSEFFRRKALTECAICEMVKGLAEEFGRSLEINVSVEATTVRYEGLNKSDLFISEPQITTKVK